MLGWAPSGIIDECGVRLTDWLLLESCLMRNVSTVKPQAKDLKEPPNAEIV